LKQYINPFSYFKNVPSLCGHLDLYKISNINEITACIETGSLIGLNANSASPSMTFIFDFIAGTNYDKEPVRNGFQKIYIDNVNELKTKYDNIHKMPFPSNDSNALTYESLVYTHKIKPLLTNNINPHFVKGFGRQINISFHDLATYIHAKTGIQLDEISKRLTLKCVDILSRADIYFWDSKHNSVTTGIIANNQPIRNYIKRKDGSPVSETELQKDVTFGMIISEGNKMAKHIATINMPMIYDNFNPQDYSNMKEGECITLKDLLLIMRKLRKEDYSILFNIYFQVTTAIYAMTINGVNHNDLHPGNIFIKKVSPRINTYNINGKSYDLNITHSVMIYDFDRAYASGFINKLNVDYDNSSYNIINSKDMLQVFGNLYFFFSQSCDEHTLLRQYIVKCLLKDPTNENDLNHMLYIFGNCKLKHSTNTLEHGPGQSIFHVHQRVGEQEDIFNDIPTVLNNIYKLLSTFNQTSFPFGLPVKVYTCPPTDPAIQQDIARQNMIFKNMSYDYTKINKLF
jgi:hypothetical protein